MINLCFYCSNIATKQFKFQRHSNGRITKPGVWCCSTFITQCPANKLRNSESNSNRNNDWKLKAKATNLEKYGVDHAMKLDSKKKFGDENSFSKPEFKATMNTRHGVTNAAQLPGVGDKISSTITSKPKEWWRERSRKQKETAVTNGNWISDSEISRMSDYRHRVQYATEVNYQLFRAMINPDNLLRARFNAYHIDHIYSIHDAFLNDVPIEVVSHYRNLRMLTESENKSKNKRSDISLDELYSRFDSDKDIP